MLGQRSFVQIIVFLALIFGFVQSVRAAEPSHADRRILLIVSSHGRDAGKTQPGFEMDELSQAYIVFKANGFGVDIASPDGGSVVADEFDRKKPYNDIFLADPVATAKIAATLTTAQAKAGDYAAIFVIGGKGAMFDLPQDRALQRLIANAYAGKRVIGAVCHGPAGLVNVRLKNGRSLIANRAVTGFSDEEEKLFGKRWSKLFPFMLESEMRKRGGRFTEAEIMLPHVERDGRLVTGQNPFSVSQTADAVVRALDRVPVARSMWADERSMELIARVTRGESGWAAEQLSSSKALYDIPLIAIWGYYRAMAAGGDKAGLAVGLKVMELAEPHYAEPQLKAAISDTRIKLAL